MKKQLTFFSVTVLILSVTACGRLNTRVDEQIEAAGSEITREPVNVERVKIRIGGGSGQIEGITIPNPEGYEAQYAFKMERLRLNIGLIASLRGPVLVLDELVILSPVLNLEFNDQGGSNLQELADRVKHNLEKAESKSVQEKPKSDDASGEPIRIAVRRLDIEGVMFNLRRADGTARSVTLPTIELTDVGGDKGKTPAGLGSVIVLAMIGEAVKRTVLSRLMDGVEIDADKILMFLDERLKLSAQQQAEIQIVAEKLSAALNAFIETRLELGFVDLGSLAEDLEPVTEDIRTGLQDILDSGQMRELEAILASLDEEAVETIRTSLVDRLAALVGVRATQMAQLRPILREHLEKLGDLLSRIATAPERSAENFKRDYDALRLETREKLKGVLSPDQMQALTERQVEIRQAIRNKLFPAE